MVADDGTAEKRWDQALSGDGAAGADGNGSTTLSRDRTAELAARALAAELPLSALVLETDAPDIAPAWLAPGRNTPGQLPRIAATLAKLRGMTPEAVADATSWGVWISPKRRT